MTEIESPLAYIQEGVFFFVQSEGSAHCTCIATYVAGCVIRGRAITTQLSFQFDARTGRGDSDEGGYACRIVSSRQPPPSIADVLHNIDRKYRFLNAPEDSRLLKQEIKALNYVDKYYFSEGDKTAG